MSMPARTARPARSTRTSTGPVPPVRRTGPVAVRPQLRLVDPQRTPTRAPARGAARASGRSRRAPFVLLVVGLLVATALSLLALNTAVAVDSLHATRQETANKAAQQRVDRLQQQVVSGGTTAELARRAAEQGLVPAGTPGHLVLDPDGTSSVQGTPSPAPAPAPSPALPSAPNPTPNPAPNPAPSPAPSPAAPGDVPTDAQGD